MNTYIAIVRKKRNGNITNIKSDYNTKKDFKEDIKANGYRLLGIYTIKQVEYIKEVSKYNMKDSFLYNNYEAIEYIKQCL